MLTVLPIVAFAGFYVLLRNMLSSGDWRHDFLRASLLFGGYLVVAIEILSLVRGITPFALAVAWLVPILVAAAWLVPRLKNGQPLELVPWRLPGGWLDRLPILSILIIFGMTGLVAWRTPPQTGDALNYHMSRVAHWAQQASVRHFATGIEQQNSRPPVAEYAILNLYVLGQGDRLATSVQWYAMVGSVIGVSFVAGQLGATTSGQRLAGLFAASLPMGIVQASSTINDYVVTFWLVNVAAEFFTLLNGEQDWRRSTIFLGLAAGLAAATKPTAYAYLLPFSVAVALLLSKKDYPRRVLKWGSLSLILVLSLNLGYVARNYVTYGSLFNPGQVKVHANEMRNVGGLLSNTLRNAGLQASTPWSEVNRTLTRGIFAVHAKLGLDPNDPRTTSHGEFWLRGITTKEDLAQNPAQAWLILIVLTGVLVLPGRAGRGTLILTLLLVTAFLVHSFVYKWQIFGSRYQLPFLVLFGAVVGAVLARRPFSGGAKLLGLGLFLAAWPWLVGIPSRPLISKDNYPVRSVMAASREELYFANGLHLKETLEEIAQIVTQANCSSVGLMLTGSNAEYLFWSILGAPRSDLDLEWIVSGATTRYAPPDFQPCAVICQTCSDEVERIRGLPLSFSRDRYRLYISPEMAQ